MAADNISILLSGDKALERKFNRLSIAVQKKITRKATREAAKPILKTAKALVSSKKSTGNLKRGIKIKALKRSRKHVGVRIVTPDASKLGIEDGSYYPAHLELGYKTKSGKQVSAKPYMRPALKQHRTASHEIMRRELKQGLDREAKKK